jgi:hypothetical protein
MRAGSDQLDRLKRMKRVVNHKEEEMPVSFSDNGSDSEHGAVSISLLACMIAVEEPPTSG